MDRKPLEFSKWRRFIDEYQLGEDTKEDLKFDPDNPAQKLLPQSKSQFDVEGNYMPILLMDWPEYPWARATKPFEPDILGRFLAADRESVLEINHYGFTVLHIACLEGQLDAVSKLIQNNRKLCLVRDKHGNTPLHSAAMKGRVDVMMELLRACPESLTVVSATDETPLHIAIRHNQVKALELLLDFIKECGLENVISKRDCAGNTIMHLAVTGKHIQIIKRLLPESDHSCIGKVILNARNNSGFTALDILDVLPQHGETDMEIEKILRKAGASGSKNLSKLKLDCRDYESNFQYPSLLPEDVKPLNTNFLAWYANLLVVSITLETILISAFETLQGNLNLLHLIMFLNCLAAITLIIRAIFHQYERLQKPAMLISTLSWYGGCICVILVLLPQNIQSVFLLGSTLILLATVVKYLDWRSPHLKLLERLCSIVRKK